MFRYNANETRGVFFYYYFVDVFSLLVLYLTALRYFKYVRRNTNLWIYCFCLRLNLLRYELKKSLKCGVCPPCTNSFIPPPWTAVKSTWSTPQRKLGCHGDKKRELPASCALSWIISCTWNPCHSWLYLACILFALFSTKNLANIKIPIFIT